MRYLSLFSGIEAASVAWEPLGWECAAVAEIDRFPCAVLAHHYPHVPNLGDVSRIGPEEIAALGRIDLVVFGSPCQDLSIAGKRKGLAGERSGLFHIALDIVRWAREYCGCRWALWENVPGAFSSNKGRDFAAVVEQMAGLDDCPVPPKGWGTEGVAVGDEAMVEWAVLDAQWFGVAQRRRRVFALADFGDWADRPPVLLEPQSLRGDTAPRRGQGADATGSTGDGVEDGGGADTLTFDFQASGAYGEASVAATLSARDYKSAKDLAVTVNALTANGVGTCGADDNQAQAGHLLPTAYSTVPMNSGTDYKARETDIAQPVMTTPVGGNQGGDYVVQPVAFDTAQITSAANGTRVSPELPASTLAKGSRMHVAYGLTTEQTPKFAEDLALTLTKQSPTGGGQPQAVAYEPYTLAIRGREGGADLEHRQDGTSNAILTPSGGRSGAGVGAVCATGEVFHALTHEGFDASEDGTGRGGGAVAYGFDWQSGGDCRGLDLKPTVQLQAHQTPASLSAMRVRRLTPTECERLQGFPDGWTQVPYRGTPASDGPRYKALGNSMAVPVMAWIGRRIAEVNTIISLKEAA
ncbi:MAG: DNA cytosine methyltransferase [Pseudomonadota bacterium]